jgi:hypothetical protein
MYSLSLRRILVSETASLFREQLQVLQVVPSLIDPITFYLPKIKHGDLRMLQSSFSCLPSVEQSRSETPEMLRNEDYELTDLASSSSWETSLSGK